MMPGLKGTADMGLGSSSASACVMPSMAHLVAQVRSDFLGDGSAPTRAEVDNDAALACHHGRYKMANDVGNALDVHIDEPIEILGRDLPERRHLIDDGGVVDQQIGRPVRGQQTSGPGLDTILDRHVHGREVVRRMMQAS